MSLARVTAFALDGVDSRRVWVEADIRIGLPAFTIVGLADKAVREARERPRAAELRFDAVGVIVDAHGELVELVHLEGAF